MNNQEQRSYQLMHRVVQVLKAENATDEEVYSIGLRLLAAASPGGLKTKT